MPEREHGKVTVGERCLRPRDRIERDIRVGDNALAILARDAVMILEPLGFEPLPRTPRCSRPNLVLRLELYALFGIGAMVDPRVDPEFRQPLVDVRAPRFPPMLQQFVPVPVALLLAKAVGPHFAHRQHDMGVWLGASVLGLVPVHIEIRDHATLHELLRDKIARQRDALLACHLTWN